MFLKSVKLVGRQPSVQVKTERLTKVTGKMDTYQEQTPHERIIGSWRWLTAGFKMWGRNRTCKMAGATPVGGICIHGEGKQIFVLFYGCWGQKPRTQKFHTSTPLESYIPSPVSKLTVNSLGSMGHPGHLSNYSTLLL